MLICVAEATTPRAAPVPVPSGDKSDIASLKPVLPRFIKRRERERWPFRLGRYRDEKGDSKRKTAPQRTIHPTLSLISPNLVPERRG